MIRALALSLLPLLLSLPGACPAAGTIVFLGADIEQTRKLHREFVELAAEDLARHGLTVEFVALPIDDAEAGHRKVEQAVAKRPTMILAGSALVALSAQRHTSTIPILFASVVDPVKIGLADSHARPGRNLTGFTYAIPVEEKQFDLVKEIAPRAKRIGVLDDGFWAEERISSARLEALEKRLSVRIEVITRKTPEAFVAAVGAPASRGIDAWLVPISNPAGMARDKLVEAIRRSGKPAVYGRTFFVQAGGLASYQELIPEPMRLWRDAMRLILRGMAPGEIPIQRPRDFELAVNLDTAKSMDIVIPAAVVRRANRVVTGPR